MIYHPTRIGILGGGQLGKMLIQEAVNLNVEIHSIDPDPRAPCSQISPHFSCGSLLDYDTVYKFGQGLDIVTIEIEHVNTDALCRLEAEGVRIFPQPQVIETIQDKGLQKLFFKEHNIPTADFHLFENKESVEAFVKAHGGNWVQKLRKGGYDGKGVILLDCKELKNAFERPSILEDKITFTKEIAVIVARSVNGETKSFEAVEMDFNPEQNLVEHLLMPAQLKPEQLQKAKELAILVAEKLGIIGILAVEMFLTTNGEFLVNEIAPRPHNSGHQTIESCYTSQFAQHIRAIMGMPLGNPSCRCAAAMINILGSPGFEGPAVYEGLEQLLMNDYVYVHLYGKLTTKPFRKMGHITILGDSTEEVMEQAKSITKVLRVTSSKAD